MNRSVCRAVLDAVAGGDEQGIARLESLIVGDPEVRKDFIEEFSQVGHGDAAAVYFKTDILEKIMD